MAKNLLMIFLSYRNIYLCFLLQCIAVMSYFSIIIPVYNKAHSIRKTLQTVLDQSYSDFEVLVVDDGSHDTSAEEVRSVRDPRISYYYKENGGVSSARNYGIAHAKGTWLLFLDADDELDQKALEVFHRLMCRYPNQRLFTAAYGLNEMQEVNHARSHLSRCPYFTLWLSCYWPCPGAFVVHRMVIERFGTFDERISFFEDLEFALRMLRYGSLVYTNVCVMRYNQAEGGLSLSSHAYQKEMAYYIPEMRGMSFFQRAILYENLEFTLLWWREVPEVLAYYRRVQRVYFSKVHAVLHWFRQQLVRHHII